MNRVIHGRVSVVIVMRASERFRSTEMVKTTSRKRFLYRSPTSPELSDGRRLRLREEERDWTRKQEKESQ